MATFVSSSDFPEFFYSYVVWTNLPTDGNCAQIGQKSTRKRIKEQRFGQMQTLIGILSH